jgi:hypothetical protein
LRESIKVRIESAIKLSIPSPIKPPACPVVTPAPAVYVTGAPVAPAGVAVFYAVIKVAAKVGFPVNKF